MEAIGKYHSSFNLFPYEPSRKTDNFAEFATNNDTDVLFFFFFFLSKGDTFIETLVHNLLGSRNLIFFSKAHAKNVQTDSMIDLLHQRVWPFCKSKVPKQ